MGLWVTAATWTGWPLGYSLVTVDVPSCMGAGSLACDHLLPRGPGASVRPQRENSGKVPLGLQSPVKKGRFPEASGSLSGDFEHRNSRERSLVGPLLGEKPGFVEDEPCPVLRGSQAGPLRCQGSDIRGQTRLWVSKLQNNFYFLCLGR